MANIAVPRNFYRLRLLMPVIAEREGLLLEISPAIVGMPLYHP
ncbi:hypothetical protein [Ferruginibacter paludis]|nr:hypothetical protein [Ferruginibacter paludis]